MVKNKGKRGVLEPETNIDLSHESTSKEEEEQRGQEDQPGQDSMPYDEGTSSSSLHNHIQELTTRVDSF